MPARVWTKELGRGVGYVPILAVVQNTWSHGRILCVSTSILGVYHRPGSRRKYACQSRVMSKLRDERAWAASQPARSSLCRSCIPCDPGLRDDLSTYRKLTPRRARK